MRAALPAVEVCPSQVRAARPQRQHSKQAASHRPSYRHRKWPTYAAPQGEGEVFACALPDYSDSQTSSSGAVYACALPEPTVAKASKGRWWQFWKRKKQERAAKKQESGSVDEISKLALSSARWQEEKVRLGVICQAYNAAELAARAGDNDTARILRERAALWAGSITSGLPTTSSLRASSAYAGGLAGAGAIADVPQPAISLSREVVVEVQPLDSGNGREIWAATPIAAPPEMVWRTLTDYERLADIVPSLVENRIIERWNGGVRLVQTAAQSVGFGLKFSAEATLDIEEHPKGIPPEAGPGESAYASNGNGDGSARRRVSRRIIPRPAGPPMGDVRDICFTLVDSRDLRMFNGTWRIEGNAKTARLLYNVEVQPQPWLPIGLVVDRVAKDIQGNLSAVRDYAESLSQNAMVIEAPAGGGGGGKSQGASAASAR